MGVLSTNVHKQTHRLGQLRQRHLPAIQISGGTAAAGGEHPTGKQRPLIGGQIPGSQPIRNQRIIDNVKRRLHLRIVIGGQQRRGRRGAHQQRQGPHQQRLAGAGLAGQNTKAGGEFNFQLMSENKMAQRQPLKHGYPPQFNFLRKVS